MGVEKSISDCPMLRMVNLARIAAEIPTRMNLYGLRCDKLQHQCADDDSTRAAGDFNIIALGRRLITGTLQPEIIA